MAFIAYDPLLGAVKLTDIDLIGPGPVNVVAGSGSGRMSFPLEILRGYDTVLGGGEFMFGQASATIAIGTVCQVNASIVNGNIVNTFAAWTGTANAGDILGVAMANLAAGQWGWFQVSGNAIVNVSGAPVQGNPAYWQAAGVISPTAVAGKQVEGAKFATAPAVTLGQGSNAYTLAATQAVVTLNRPSSQGQIT